MFHCCFFRFIFETKVPFLFGVFCFFLPFFGVQKKITVSPHLGVTTWNQRYKPARWFHSKCVLRILGSTDPDPDPRMGNNDAISYGGWLRLRLRLGIWKLDSIFVKKNGVPTKIHGYANQHDK